MLISRCHLGSDFCSEVAVIFLSVLHPRALVYVRFWLEPLNIPERGYE